MRPVSRQDRRRPHAAAAFLSAARAENLLPLPPPPVPPAQASSPPVQCHLRSPHPGAVSSTHRTCRCVGTARTRLQTTLCLYLSSTSHISSFLFSGSSRTAGEISRIPGVPVEERGIYEKPPEKNPKATRADDRPP